MAVHLPRGVAEQLKAAAKEVAPEEACGILTGNGIIINGAIPIPNAAAFPERAYVLDPPSLLQAINHAQTTGQELLGFYHSHPKHDAQPSSLDIREWHYPDLLMVIISPAADKIAAWRVNGVEVTPVELTFGAASTVAEIPLSNAGKTAIIVSVILAILAVLVVSFTLLPPAPPIP
ncbi:MAG: M67 family metallopeptidase [Anaerolineae bacterium]|nr:M67 family metallopeptidase [Anaerolineae bacterium]